MNQEFLWNSWAHGWMPIKDVRRRKTQNSFSGNQNIARCLLSDCLKEGRRKVYSMLLSACQVTYCIAPMFRIGLSTRAQISSQGHDATSCYIHDVTTRAFGPEQEAFDCWLPFVRKLDQRFVCVLGSLYLVFCWATSGSLTYQDIAKVPFSLMKDENTGGAIRKSGCQNSKWTTQRQGWRGVKAIKINSLPFWFEGREVSATYDA